MIFLSAKFGVRNQEYFIEYVMIKLLVEIRQPNTQTFEN